MKKFYFCIAALAIAAIGCNKVEEETSTTTPVEQPQKENVVYLSANLPEFVDTKATISDAGAFAWEDGDVISVLCKRAEDNQFWYVDFTYDASEGMFYRDMATACAFKSGSSGIEQVNGTFTVATATEMASQTGTPFAIYPAQFVATSDVNYDKIGKLFQMEGSLETDGSINFVHKSALIKLEYTDVPSIAKKIIVTNGTEVVTALLNNATGNVKTMIPVTPSGSELQLNIELCAEDGTLIAKKKTANLVAGKLYKAPAITINPTVYLASNMTGWDTDNAYKNAPMTKSGDTYTLDLQSMGSQYAKVFVEYPSGKVVRMGPGVADDANFSKQYVVDATHATKLNEMGAYNFSYNNVTGQMTIAKSGDIGAFYFYGVQNTWGLDTAIPLTNNSGMFMWEGVVGGDFKFLYNKYAYSSLGGDAYNWLGADKNNIPTTAGNYYLMFAKPSTWQYWLADMGAPGTAPTDPITVSLSGEFNSWNESDNVKEFTKDGTYDNIWRLTYTPEADGNVKIVKNHAWDTSWGFGNLVYNPLEVTGTDNIYLKKDVEYHIVINVNSGKVAIY